MLPIRLTASVAAVTMCAFTSAQTAVTVSPTQTALLEGNSNNAFPWNSTTVRRYTQIHSDLGASALAITRLAFRGNAGNTTNYTAIRDVDMEMSMGPSVDFDRASFVFAANYLAPPTIVVARRIVNIGPLGQNATTGPLPFTIFIPLDAPYNHPGTVSLIWDAAVFSNTIQTGSGTFNQIDAEGGSQTSATSTITGTGCIATGRTTAMTHTLPLVANGNVLLFYPTVSNGPSSAPTILTLGATNPAIPYPGLCAPIMTDLLLMIDIGLTSATGAISGDTGLGWVIPNVGLTGATITTQAFSVDLSRVDPIPLSASNGRSHVIPAPNTTNIVRVSRIYNSSTGATGTLASPVTTSIGYGIVTEFTH